MIRNIKEPRQLGQLSTSDSGGNYFAVLTEEFSDLPSNKNNGFSHSSGPNPFPNPESATYFAFTNELQDFLRRWNIQHLVAGTFSGCCRLNVSEEEKQYSDEEIIKIRNEQLIHR